MSLAQRSDYTFKYNVNLIRHGWLRLTPAYSVKLVRELLVDKPKSTLVLDPFSGTATTPVVAAELGMTARSFDVNDFLVWFGNVKCHQYQTRSIDYIRNTLDQIVQTFYAHQQNKKWLPAMHNIERWWSPKTLDFLSSLRESILRKTDIPGRSIAGDILWIAFCRLIIETSSAAFNHVSMSFKDQTISHEREQIIEIYELIVRSMLSSLNVKLAGDARVSRGDSCEPLKSDIDQFDCVVTSPPYPNRISYIRELRPYMYWTSFLTNAKEAGELDWQSVGGTWGIATSRLTEWTSTNGWAPAKLMSICSKIDHNDNKNGHLMSTYVFKYFHDMHRHLKNLRSVLKRGAILHYIVGNSTFYGIGVPTDELLMMSMESLGYSNLSSLVVRKRNSKKELFEYCVSAEYSA